MPTENRSSTIEQHDHIEGIIDMVSVPREVIEFAAGLKWHGYKSGTDQKDDQLQALNKLRTILAAPAPQPHPEPIAWMVGTAIWWTKEEAERDSAATRLPIVGLGPMTGSGEVERLRGEVRRLHEAGEFLDSVSQGIEDKLRAQLAEGDALLRELLADDVPLRLAAKIETALSASAEPCATAKLIPEGYCIMPRRLTAENGAKALLLGEFKLEVTRECPQCLDLDEPAEGCEICDGEGAFAQRHTIPWEQIKFIYSEAVKGLALKPNTAR